MQTLPKPAEPLRILTLDGVGLQAISTLTILDNLLNVIAKLDKNPKAKPRPCDVFDVIAGIGSGGWLALLLGRFQLEIPSALAEWCHICEYIKPREGFEQTRMWWKHQVYDPACLTEEIDRLVKFYGIDEHMYFVPPPGTRCKHVLVGAIQLDDDPKFADLFHTYDHPTPWRVHWSLNPHTVKISDAFGATGAVRFFSPPFTRDFGDQKTT